MTRKGYWCRIVVAAACLLTAGQATAQYYSLIGCTQQDVQLKMRFFDAPGHIHVVAVEYKNTGSKPCALPTFKLANGEAAFPLTARLQPGDVVNSSFRWSTQGKSCHRLSALEFLTPPIPNPLQYAYTTLLPDACSPLRQTDFIPGEFVPDWKAESTAADPPLHSAPVLSIAQQTYYADEPILLHVKLTDRPATDTSCPPLIESVRDPQGNTRLFQRTQPENGCHPLLPPLPRWTGPPNEFEFRTGGTLNWGVTGLGEVTYTIYQLSAPTALGERRLVASNSVTVNVVRPPEVCLAKDLEPALHFYDAPDNTEVVALNYRNTSDSICLFKMVLARKSTDTTYPMAPIQPGDTVHSSVRLSKDWSQCENLRTLEFGGSIFSPTLLPKVCKDWEASDYLPGPFVPDWKTPGSSAETAPPPPVLIAPKQTYYEHEMIELRLQVQPGSVPDGKCPVLLETVHGGRETEMREIPNQGVSNSSDGCRAWTTSRGALPRRPNEYPIEVFPDGTTGLDALGERTITVAQLAGTEPDGERRLLSSNAVTVKVVDGATIPRNWGDTEKGVRVNLTLDKLSYAVGDNIPLHLAFQNVSAGAGTVFGGPVGCDNGSNPEAIDFRLKVEKQDGSAPQFFERPMSDGITECVVMSNGLSHSIPQGKPLLVEGSLFLAGMLPREPGIYRVTATWNVRADPNAPVEDITTVAPRQRITVTVTSVPLLVRITANADSNGGR